MSDDIEKIGEDDEDCTVCLGTGEIEAVNIGEDGLNETLPCPTCVSRELNERIAALTAAQGLIDKPSVADGCKTAWAQGFCYGDPGYYPPASPVMDGWRMVPVEPTEAMWGNGLVRWIVRWMGYERPTPKALLFDLKNGYGEPPEWLTSEAEMQTPDHVVSKGTRATILYRAMLAAAPASPVPAASEREGE